MLQNNQTLIKWTKLANSRRRIIDKPTMRQAVSDLLPGFRYVEKRTSTDTCKVISADGKIYNNDDILFEAQTNLKLLLSILDYITPDTRVLDTGIEKIDYIRNHKQDAENRINEIMQQLNQQIGDEFDLQIIKRDYQYKIALI